MQVGHRHLDGGPTGRLRDAWYVEVLSSVAEMRLLGNQALLGLRCNGVQVGARGGKHQGGHQALDQRRGREPDPAARFGRQQLDRHLGAQHGTAQVEQYQHTVGPIDFLDRRCDGGRIGA
jgi:hypothetical protein